MNFILVKKKDSNLKTRARNIEDRDKRAPLTVYENKK